MTKKFIKYKYNSNIKRQITEKMKSSIKIENSKNTQENNKKEHLEDLKEECEDIYSTSNNLDENDTALENPEIKKHKRCVPLEIYTKVYKDKQTLLNQVELLNQEISSLNNDQSNKLKDNNELMKILDNKCKNLQREKTNIENILLNQENYVDKLKKKIEKLENQIAQKNEEIVQKDNNIIELNDKIEELNNKINNLKQSFKLNEKKEISNLNERILSLINEVEIKQSRIDFINKRHKHLQIKYLKLLGEKSKYSQDLIPLYNKKDKDKEKESEINSTTGSRHIYTIKSYSSIKKTENNIKNHNMINMKGKRDFSSLNLKLYKELYLPEIKKRENKINKEFFSKIDKSVQKNNQMKEINYIISDYSDQEEENKYKNEEFEKDE